MSSSKCLSLFPENPGGCRSVNTNNSTKTSRSEENQTIVEQPQERVVRESHRVRRPRLHRVRRPSLSQNFTIHLPEGVIQNIFSFFPVKEAARLSLLAPSYKNSVYYSRKLEFDFQFGFRENFLQVVDHIFNHHEGPAIQSFQIHFDATGIEEQALKWIEKAINKGVEELDLYFFVSAQPFRLPPGLLNTETIRILKLNYIEITFPPQLTGLRFLRTLVLRIAVNVTGTMIENIMEHCMLLECLDLSQCGEIEELSIQARNHQNFKVLKIGDCPRLDQIDILAPRLCSFHYLGGAAGFKLYLPVSADLTDVQFHFFPPKHYLAYFSGLKLLHTFADITKFTTNGPLLESLTVTDTKDDETNSQVPCLKNLKELHVVMRGANHTNSYDIACFLRICPELEKLFLNFNSFSLECGIVFQMHHKESLERYNRPFKDLKVIKITGFRYRENEVGLVKFLLRTTPMLEDLVLVTAKTRRKKLSVPERNHRDMICCCDRASPTSRVRIYEQGNDRSAIFPTHPEAWF